MASHVEIMNRYGQVLDALLWYLDDPGAEPDQIRDQAEDTLLEMIEQFGDSAKDPAAGVLLNDIIVTYHSIVEKVRAGPPERDPVHGRPAAHGHHRTRNQGSERNRR